MITRSDESATVQFTINVKKGHCKPRECADGLIQNLDVASCDCEPLQAYEGTLYDLSVHTGTEFAFTSGLTFTFREWALTTGGYEWTLPATADIQCFT
jgi:hypothetical protein